MEVIRDPLVLAYEAIAVGIRNVHGDGFPVFDDAPDATEFIKKLPAANMSYVSGGVEKALMREFIPHRVMRNEDGRTFTVVTETARFDYIIQISFFADKKGKARAHAVGFQTATEVENEIALPGDPWEEVMQIFSVSPPLPPYGEPNLYRCDQTWRCRGKLLTTETVNEVDIKNLKFKIGGWKCLF